MRILITGAGGFLGSHLISFLKNNLETDFEIFNLGKNKINNSNLLFLDDIKNQDQINKYLSDIRPHYLFHLAGAANSSIDLNESKLVNVDYAKFLLRAIEINNIQHQIRVLVTGTSAEYGRVSYSELPISENYQPNPESIYGKTKYEQTLHALNWHKPDRNLVIVRPFNVIGLKMPIHLALGSFINQIESLPDKGDLKTGNLNTKRDFIDVDDVINLMWKLINNKHANGEIINICSGKAVAVGDILELAIKLSGKEISIVSEEERIRKNDLLIHFGDNTKLLKIVGDYNFTSWKNTINKIMEN